MLTKFVEWGGRCQHRTTGGGGGIDNEHRKGRLEKDGAPVGAADIDSKQRQPRLAVEFENCSHFKFDQAVAQTAASSTVERRRGSSAKVKAAMARWRGTMQTGSHTASKRSRLSALQRGIHGARKSNRESASILTFK